MFLVAMIKFPLVGVVPKLKKPFKYLISPLYKTPDSPSNTVCQLSPDTSRGTESKAGIFQPTENLKS